MYRIREYIAAHPEKVALMFAVFGGILAYDWFRAGMAVAVIRSEVAREHSIMMGG
jgi:hypothetical protein